MLAIMTACCGTPEKKPVYKTGDMVNVTGTVSVAGNEPFTKMIIRIAGKKEAFILPVNYKKEKRELIGKSVRASGRIEVIELKSADKKYTVFEYHLSPDKIAEEESAVIK